MKIFKLAENNYNTKEMIFMADKELKLETKCYDANEYGYLYGLNKRISDEEFEKIKPYMRNFRRKDFVDGIIKVTGRPEGYRCLEKDVAKVEEILGIENTLEKRQNKIKKAFEDPVQKVNLKDKAYDWLNTLFKKTGNDLNKLNLWIARADELAGIQEVNEYNKDNFHFLIQDIKEISYKDGINIEELQNLFNKYGIYFVVEKALSGSKVRGCFKVKCKNPAIYITKNYTGKDSFYFELFHELGHCKSDYNVAISKVIVDGDEDREKRADKFALETMISNDIWEEIKEDYNENNLLKLSQKYKIPMSFIVGRMAKLKVIEYSSELYNKYKMI